MVDPVSKVGFVIGKVITKITRDATAASLQLQLMKRDRSRMVQPDSGMPSMPGDSVPMITPETCLNKQGIPMIAPKIPFSFPKHSKV